MAQLKFSTPDGKRAYEIHDEFITIGREVGNHLRLSDPAVAPVHLRLIHGKNGYRLEPADASLPVEVNGESCGACVLHPEDRIRIGDTTLTFVDEPASAAAPQRPAASPHPVRRAAPAAAAHGDAAHHDRGHGHGHAHAHGHGHAHAHGHEHGHGHGHGHGHHHGHGHGHKKPQWLLWISLCAVAFVLLLILPPLFGAGAKLREESSPANHLAQAEIHFQQGSYQRALDSCQVADMRGPDDGTRERIQDLRKRIQERMGREGDQTALDNARLTLESLQQFETTYLAKPQPGPAARELARNAKIWLDRYTEVVKRHPDRAADVQKVKSMFDRFTPIAKLERPDDASDVLFAVDRRLALSRPQYREALALIDDYLRTHPNDPGATQLKDARTRITQAAREEFDRREAAARRHLTGGRFAEARKEVDAMRDAMVNDGWGKIADAVDQEIQRAEKK